ncbi:hypothetical protein L211DRAFT_854478 [Terfezia boudieri ATCC MYA-4762]|uniref:Uncharacterized protein n=1 Tax=Terfezia boudieri ATCC MYA-4762 TaxID=1051890 RepID=A0A3N4L5G1_9PEZI|nr:hypothetical protein L211DRAFT_854478 [Terfezia boudieri ATCC MYA-4762]
MAHLGHNLMDVQVELDPIGQVNTPRVHMAALTRLAAPTSAPASQHDTKHVKAILTKRATNIVARKSSSSLVPRGLSRSDYVSSALRPLELTKVQKHLDTAKEKTTAKGKITSKTTTKQAPKGTPAAKAIKDTLSDHEVPSSEDIPDVGASYGRMRHLVDRAMVRHIVLESWRVGVRGSGVPHAGQSVREPFWTGRRRVRASTRHVADMEEEVCEHGTEEGLGGKVADDEDGDIEDSTDKTTFMLQNLSLNVRQEDTFVLPNLCARLRVYAKKYQCLVERKIPVKEKRRLYRISNILLQHMTCETSQPQRMGIGTQATSRRTDDDTSKPKETGLQKGGCSTPGMPRIPETLGTSDLPHTPGIPGTPGTPQLLCTPTRTDESPYRNMFSNGNGVSSLVALLESPIRPPMGLVGGKPNLGEVTKGYKRNRLITQFTGVLQDMIESVGNKIEYITLFEEPFPDSQRAEDILTKVWREAERHHKYHQTRDNRIDAYIRQTSECSIPNKITPGFGGSLFMCFIFTALFYALTAWESGECQLVAEFSYINCSNVYKRLLAQWQLYPTSVQEMILKVIQWEIVKKGNKSGKTVRWQQDTAYKVDPEEVADFSKHLIEQLKGVGIQSAQRVRDEEDHESTTEEDI